MVLVYNISRYIPKIQKSPVDNAATCINLVRHSPCSKSIEIEKVTILESPDNV
jgi:hypothetical protein